MKVQEILSEAFVIDNPDDIADELSPVDAVIFMEFFTMFERKSVLKIVQNEGTRYPYAYQKVLMTKLKPLDRKQRNLFNKRLSDIQSCYEHHSSWKDLTHKQAVKTAIKSMKELFK